MNKKITNNKAEITVFDLIEDFVGEELTREGFCEGKLRAIPIKKDGKGQKTKTIPDVWNEKKKPRSGGFPASRRANEKRRKRERVRPR